MTNTAGLTVCGLKVTSLMNVYIYSMALNILRLIVPHSSNISVDEEIKQLFIVHHNYNCQPICTLNHHCETGVTFLFGHNEGTHNDSQICHWVYTCFLRKKQTNTNLTWLATIIYCGIVELVELHRTI